MAYSQARRWPAAGGFDVIVRDLGAVLRFAKGRNAELTAAIFDGRTMQSTSESGGWAGYDGAMLKQGSKVHVAVVTLGHLRALHVPPADEQDRLPRTLAYGATGSSSPLPRRFWQSSSVP